MRLRVIVFALVAIAVAAGLVLPSAGAKPPKPVKVKAGQSFSEACPSGYTADGGTVEWYNKDGRLVGTGTGTVVGTSTVMFGPAPAGTTTAVTELNCQPPAPTTTAEPTTTSSTTTTTVAPTTTTVPDPTIHLRGSFTYPTDGEPRFIYGGDPSLGFPVCPAGTSFDLDASVIDLPSDVTLMNFLDQEIPSLIVETPYIDVTGNGDYETRTITYDYACVPA
jgi:hypothetical protein